jgi:hypothetical protein
MSVAKEIHRYILQNYGNLISTSQPLFDDKTRTWIAQLQTDYPRLIPDDRSPSEKIVKFLSMKNLGTIRFSEDLKPRDATPREDCIKQLNTFLKIWQERAERIIVTASSDQLARIGETQWILAPFRMIVSYLLQKEVMYDNEVERERPIKERKLGQYLKLLESLDLVRRIDNGYTHGNLFTALLEKSTNTMDFKTAIMSCLIRERYSMLRDIFAISQLETFVHVDSCYYKPALEAEKIVHLKRDTIINYYFAFYGKKSPVRLAYILDELVGANALKSSDKYYYGNEELFDRMLNMKNELQELGTLRV